MNLIIFILIFATASNTSRLDWNDQFTHKFIVWNIGQGSWSTIVRPHFCVHFDLGGEHPPDQEKLLSVCGGKKQIVVLSHYDRDHINFLFWFYDFMQHKLMQQNNFCAFGYPALQTADPLHKKKSTIAFYQRLIKNIPLCSENFHKNLKTIYSPTLLSLRASNSKITSNDLSRVFQWDNIIIPGDSTAQQEKKWGIHTNAEAQILILGHHGSRTSTSDELLNHLPHLKVAIVSARKSVYGHPHKEVLTKLKKYKVPLLRTEVWGNIVFE
jgi:competence protein ComEC